MTSVELNIVEVLMRKISIVESDVTVKMIRSADRTIIASRLWMCFRMFIFAWQNGRRARIHMCRHSLSPLSMKPHRALNKFLLKSCSLWRSWLWCGVHNDMERYVFSENDKTEFVTFRDGNVNSWWHLSRYSHLSKVYMICYTCYTLDASHYIISLQRHYAHWRGPWEISQHSAW